MHFLAPWNLLWLCLLAPLILLYILKKRRQEQAVGSTLLWQQALRDMRAERPFKRLIPQLNLLLQVLAIVVGALALARPAIGETLEAGSQVCVVVDTSASMAAESEGTSSFARARLRLRALAQSLGPAGRMMIIEAAEVPEVRSALEREGAALRRAIDSLHVRGGGANLEAAVALAVDRLRDAPDGSRIIVLTDGALTQDLSLVQGGAAPVAVELLSPSAVSNTAIVDAAVRVDQSERAGASGRDRSDIFVRVYQSGAHTVDVFVTAYDAESGLLVASRRIRVEPGQTQTLIMNANLPPDSEGHAPIVRVALEGAERAEWNDALALDDEAFVPSPGSRRLPVFLVGTAPPAVRRVVRADPRVELFSTTLAALEEEPVPLDGLVIYTGVVPNEPPAGDSVVIAPEGETGTHIFELELGPVVENPRILTWADGDLRLRFLQLGHILLGQSRTLLNGQALVSAQQGALVATSSRPGGETTVLAFDPQDGLWPRDASFVVFFRNLLERARDRRAAGGIEPGSLGETLRVPAPEGVVVTVTTPDGQHLQATSRGGLALIPVGAAPGVYHAEIDGLPSRTALRSLMDAEESNLAPRLSLGAGPDRARGGQATEQAEVLEGSDATSAFALLLLLLLAAETLWSTRRALRAGKLSEKRSSRQASRTNHKQGASS